MKILLHCDDRRRDAVTMWLLRDALSALGHQVLVCSRPTLRKYDRWFDPDVLVLSHVFTYGGAEELERKARHAKVCVLPTEGATLSRGSRLTSYSGLRLHTPRRNALTQWVSRVFIWGEATGRALIEEGLYQPSQVVVTGCPRFDLYRSALFRKTKQAASPRIGALGDFPTFNPFDQRNPLLLIDQVRHEQGIYYDEDKDLEDLFWLQYAQFRLMLELMELATTRHHLPVDYRPHPFECIRNYRFLRPRLGKSFTLEQGATPFFLWLARSAAMAVTSSSAVVEAFITGIPAVTLQPLLDPRRAQHMNLPDFCHPMLSACHRPASLDEAVDLLKQALDGTLAPTDVTQPEVAAFLKAFYDWPRHEPSVITIARAIDRLTSETVNGARPQRALPRADAMTTLGLWALNSALWCRYGFLEPSPVHRHNHWYPWHGSDRRLAQRVSDQFEGGIDANRACDSAGVR